MFSWYDLRGFAISVVTKWNAQYTQMLYSKIYDAKLYKSCHDAKFVDTLDNNLYLASQQLSALSVPFLGTLCKDTGQIPYKHDKIFPNTLGASFTDID